MSHKVFYAFTLAVVLTGSAASAHDARLHKGKPTVGTVESRSENSINLKTATGTTIVTFQDKTKFERGEAQASAQEIQQGDQLTVFGTKLPSGELVAREVLLPATNAKGESHSHPTTH
jgi:uncharacterized protein DUF5666